MWCRLSVISPSCTLISVSVAALVLTTEALVHDEPKELTKDQELAAMDQMAGMGGMEYM